MVTSANAFDEKTGPKAKMMGFGQDKKTKEGIRFNSFYHRDF